MVYSTDCVIAPNNVPNNVSNNVPTIPPVAHESAHLHVLGEATYTDDIPEHQGTLHAALGLSTRAHANLLNIDLSAVKQAAGVVAVFCAQDIPGSNNCGPILHDDPILADGLVQYLGQAIFLVVAQTRSQARAAAKLAQITYQDLPAIFTPEQARAAQAFVLPPMHLQRGDAETALANAAHTLQGQFFVGGQEQFYLEGQIAYALPQEGQTLQVHSSTQHPSEMQQLIAHALGWQAHQVNVSCRRMGGGFGGKESQSAIWACAAAIAAVKLQRPVKLRPDRDDDFLVTGKRHCFYYEYQVGFNPQGIICAAKVEMVLRCGYSADLSGPVATRAICHFDNAYYLSDVDILALCGKTNTQSNTAFRGFGGPQGAIAIENAIDDIARYLGVDALDIRLRNLYRAGKNLTPYGQTVSDNILAPLIAQLETSSDYRQRRAAINEFNRHSPILKKGLAFTPVKFGIAFNLQHLNQAGALLHIYTDGSILINHGGTEMGQGLHTKIMQVVAQELGVSLRHVRINATDTSKIANTSATAASTGADLNGKAAQNAAQKLRTRLAQLAAQILGGEAATVAFANDTVHSNGQQIPFAELVSRAYIARIQLWSDGFYATPGLAWDRSTLTGQPFQYFAYGAAVSEVLLDTLTGEWRCLRADLLYDAGNSLNSAIDIGQVEGGFIQGMGWLTTEQLYWNPQGKLTTHAPSTYKIPAISDCPPDFRVALYQNTNQADSIYRSKAAGEPPLLLSFSVFFALRDAVSSINEHRTPVALMAPATSEALCQAIDALKLATTHHPAARHAP